MPLNEKQFAALVQSMPGASDEEILRKARELGDMRLMPSHEPTPPPEPTLWEKANTPTLSLPRSESSHPHAKVANFAAEVAEGMSSPMGFASAILSGAGSALGRAGLLGISRAARVAEGALNVPYAVEGVTNVVQGAANADPAQAVAGGIEAGLAGLGVRGAAQHSFPPRRVAQAYTREAGISNPEPVFTDKWDQSFASQVGDAYEAMPHAPNDPAVAASYGQMAEEIKNQFAFLRDRAGLRMEPWLQEGQPYANSKEMMSDIQSNNHLWFFPSKSGFGSVDGPVDNPLLQPGVSGQPVNDELRAVHDYFGHAQRGHQFGPVGEENAYREHAAMFSPEAVPAMTTETRGQNSWVNAGKHLRREDGTLPKKGDSDFIPPQNRPFAEQKTGLLPSRFIGPNASTAMSVAGPVGAMAVPEDDESNWDEVTRALMIGGSVVGLGAAAMHQVKSPVSRANILAAGQTAIGKSPDEIASFLRTQLPDIGDRIIGKAIQFGRKKFDQVMKETGGKFTDREGISRYIDAGWNKRRWYEEGSELIEEMRSQGKIVSDEDERVFAGFLGAMGNQNPPKQNYRDAVALFEGYKQGKVKLDKRGNLRVPPDWNPQFIGRDNIINTLRGGELTGRKIHTYGGQLAGREGFADKLTADRWHARLHGFDASTQAGQGAIDDATYEMMEQFWQQLSREKGVPVQQLQAAGWFGIRNQSSLQQGAWKKPQQGHAMLQQKRLAEAEQRFIKKGIYQQTTRAQKDGAPVTQLALTDKGRSLVRQRARFVLGELEKTGGATINLEGGKRRFKEGYAVSVFPERELIIPANTQVTENHIASFIQDNLDLLEEPDVNLGVWRDDSGQTFLDLSLVLSNLDTAQAMGAKLGQRALYDFGSGSSVAIPPASAQEQVPPFYARLKELWEKLQPADESFVLEP